MAGDAAGAAVEVEECDEEQEAVLILATHTATTTEQRTQKTAGI